MILILCNMISTDEIVARFIIIIFVAFLKCIRAENLKHQKFEGMGISSESRDVWPRKNMTPSPSPFVIPSPIDRRTAEETTQRAYRKNLNQSVVCILID